MKSFAVALLIASTSAIRLASYNNNLPACSALPAGTAAQPGQNCQAAAQNLPACNALPAGTAAQPGDNCQAAQFAQNLPACASLPEAQRNPGNNCQAAAQNLPA